MLKVGEGAGARTQACLGREDSLHVTPGDVTGEDHPDVPRGSRLCFLVLLQSQPTLYCISHSLN